VRLNRSLEEDRLSFLSVYWGKDLDIIPGQSAGTDSGRVKLLKYRWTLIAVVYFLAVLLANLLNSSGQSFTGLFALVPVLLALEWGPAIVLLGSLPLSFLAASDLFRGTSPTSATVIRTVGVTAGTGIGVYIASYRERHAARLGLSRAAAVAAQEAILPDVPEALGRYRFSCAYRSAADESLVGGDMYKVVETDFGVRLLVGDVRGKGLAAISLTAVVLGCFREWAPETGTLKHIVARLNARVIDKAAPGEFVTAVVASFDDNLVVEIANCGHPSPVHLTARGPRKGVLPESRTTPLGMDPEPSVSTLQLASGDRMFFYTDGLIESRDRDGEWIELDEALIGTLGSDPFETALERLLNRLEERVGTFRDDIALLLMECADAPAPGQS
jgi:serine phosphatase RsbU (regulator of sigma subunit)